MTVCYPDLAKHGRLGNQLWQIASTIGLARKHEGLHANVRLPAWVYQPYFRVPDYYFADGPGGTPATDLVPHLDPRARPYLQEHGLWSSDERAVALVRAYFEPSATALATLDSIWAEHGFADMATPIAAVHVRRTDMVTTEVGYHPVRSREYYREAIKLVPEDSSIVVFSDEPDWCLANVELWLEREVALVYEGVVRPVDSLDVTTAPILDWVDLQLMARCDHHVLSNSSYAWWAAYLSSDPSPIYPSNWYGLHVRDWTDASVMFPPTWREVFDPTQGGI